MIVIAEPHARYAPTLGEGELERAAADLLGFAVRIAQSHFDERYERLEITVVVRVEVGSTRVWITIGAVVSALTFYGNIRQSVDYLVRDARTLARIILPRIPESLGIKSQPPEYQERRLGIPGRLRRLFRQVERGEISADEATRQAIILLQRHGGPDVIEGLPGLMERLSSEFQQAGPQDLPRLMQRLSSEPDQLAGHRKAPKVPPTREFPVPEFGLPPVTPVRRRRGVIAIIDRQTGDPRVSRY